MGLGFEYKKNCFYIEDRGNILRPYQILYSDILSGCMFSTKEDYNKAIAVDHELNHYVQDLSIYACITEGFFMDYMAAFVRDLSINKTLQFPLDESKNKEYNTTKAVLSEEEKLKLDYYYETSDIYEFIYKTKHKKNSCDEYFYNSPNENVFEEMELSYTDLLESYAYHKAYWDFYIRATTAESCELLHIIVKENKVYPLWFENGQYFVNIKDINWNRPYQIVNFLLLIGLPCSHEPLLKYYEEEIPHNYHGSPAEFMHSITRLVLETALNIPSIDYIMSSVFHYGKNKDDFSPVHRFYKIIKKIREYGGFPDAKDGEDFFITFFNWVADEYEWPNFKETTDSIVIMLNNRVMANKECISSFQLRAVAKKNESFNVFAQIPPFKALGLINLPLLINNSEGIFIQHLFNDFTVDCSGLTNFYTEFFCQEMPTYKTIDDNENWNEAMENAFNNNRGAIKEIINRLFSNASYLTYRKKGTFSCPLALSGCPYSGERCQFFNEFTTVLGNCKKRVLRFAGKKMFSQKEDGNVEDCMYFNYLLDNKYNINKIEK